MTDRQAKKHKWNQTYYKENRDQLLKQRQEIRRRKKQSRSTKHPSWDKIKTALTPSLKKEVWGHITCIGNAHTDATNEHKRQGTKPKGWFHRHTQNIVYGADGIMYMYLQFNCWSQTKTPYKTMYCGWCPYNEIDQILEQNKALS